MQYDLHATTDRQDILVLHRIFAEAGLRRELSRTKASAIREAPPCGRGVSLHLKKQQSVGLNMV